MWTSVAQSLRSPQWIARVVWLVGAMTIASALVPAVKGRVGLVTDLLPDFFPAAATTAALAVGTVLMVLAHPLRRGKFRAWLLATVLCGVAVVVHLVKGLDVEEAAVSGLVLALLLSARRGFTARPDPRSLRRVLTVALGGATLGTLLGWGWLSFDADGQAAGTTSLERLQSAAVGLVGLGGPVRFLDTHDAVRAAIALLVLGATVVVALVVALTMPHDGPHPISADEMTRVRLLLARWGQVDSLSYFATREDRSVIFSPSGRAAITYRVVGAVSLAAGDPIGDPADWRGAVEAWLDEARSYGWVPAALGVSERAAEVFGHAGLDALELGDEAIVEVAGFGLEGRNMRGVRQASSRCARVGLEVVCVRVRDLDERTRAEIRERAEAWRDGPVERGFSMALGRIVAAEDGDAVVVLCRDQENRLHGLLSLVPWGTDGLSLDLMRRDRDSVNGIVEHMVAELCRACPDLGIDRLSLNFAVFRAVFARGERLGAGPVLRVWHGLLLGLSRFWQIESLYRANAKYRPTWTPRFLCFRSPGDLPRVGTAALRAEAFLVAPSWARPALSAR